MIIKEIKLLSNDLKKTEQFYNEILDTDTASNIENEVSFLIGTTRLTFINSTIPQPNYHLAIDIPNNQLDNAFNWLNERTVILPVTETSKFSEFNAWNARSFYFYDNNGNLLELICRYDVPNQSTVSFSSTHLLYISEIGIVTDHVSTTAKELIEKYGIEYYSKQPKQENFAVLGDESGLLILVNPERNWYPTLRKAEPFYTEITFSTANDLLQILTTRQLSH